MCHPSSQKRGQGLWHPHLPPSQATQCPWCLRTDPEFIQHFCWIYNLFDWQTQANKHENCPGNRARIIRSSLGLIYLFKHGLMKPRLAWNSQLEASLAFNSWSSSLYLLSTGMSGTDHHTWLQARNVMNANFLNCDDTTHLLWVSCVVLRWARIQGKVVLSHLEYILRAEVEAQTCLS